MFFFKFQILGCVVYKRATYTPENTVIYLKLITEYYNLSDSSVSRVNKSKDKTFKIRTEKCSSLI